MSRRSFRTDAAWVVPPLVALVLYWPGLTAWFQKDDFAWLALRDMVHNWHDLGWALFAPLAQGTIRTLSERVFFMSFYSLFGLHALPYRGLAFLTYAAALVVLSSVCVKLTGSQAAGFWAAILWTVNCALAFALSWTAIYYQLLCSLSLLFSFWLLIRYVETGDRRFYIAQWITFLLGFGILELNVVYPALALAYAMCCAPGIIRKVFPLFVPAAAYTWVHMTVAPLQSSGPYKMFWDVSVWSTLWTYWKYALGPNRLMYLGFHPSAFRSALAIALMTGLLAFLVGKLYRRAWVAAFFPAWFIIVLAPVLPLRDHITDSYLTVPLIGLAMWGGWALVSGWRAGKIGRVATLVVLAVYLCVSVPVARALTSWFAQRSYEIRGILFDVASISRSQPNKLVLLKGVDSTLFWDALYHRPLRLFGIPAVYLLKEDEGRIVPGPQPESVRNFFLNASEAHQALDENRAVVIDISGGHARDITSTYRRPSGAP